MPSPAPDMKYLAIYLNDHLAGATAGVHLARRAAEGHAGTPSGGVFGDLATDLEADRATLVDLMGRLEIAPSRLKTTGATVGERLGRLKLNGHLRTASPLSEVVEAEGLTLGVEGKLLLWSALTHALPGDPRLAGIDFELLQARATAQRDRLHELRLAAATSALTR